MPKRFVFFYCRGQLPFSHHILFLYETLIVSTLLLLSLLLPSFSHQPYLEVFLLESEWKRVPLNLQNTSTSNQMHSFFSAISSTILNSSFHCQYLTFTMAIYLYWLYQCNTLTSDPAKLSDEKCTCVNNIQFKISGDNLGCRRAELSANCDATGSRWMSNNDITRVRQEVS